MKDMKRYLKTMPVLLVAFMLLAVTGYAAILTNYGQITGEVEVTEAITLSLNGGDVTGYTVSGVAGSTYAQGIYEITNNAEVPVTMEIVTTYPEEDACDGVTTTEHSTVGVLELTGKSDCSLVTNPGGGCTPTDVKATVYYTIIGNEFIYDVVGQDDFDTTDYTLIYYLDYDYEAYTGEAFAMVSDIGSLPMENDLNGGVNSNYCTNELNPDNVNCQGAKLWLVPNRLFENGILTWENDAFLFETDLIHYNANVEVGIATQVSVNSGTLGTDLGEVTVMPGETMDFVIQNEISSLFVESVGSLCTMTTTLVPVE